MFEDPMAPADSDDGPEDQVEAAESSAEQHDSGETVAEVAAGADPEVSSDPPGSRGLRLVRWVILLFVVSLATVEISSPLCSGYSLGAIESAF